MICHYNFNPASYACKDLSPIEWLEGLRGSSLRRALPRLLLLRLLPTPPLLLSLMHLHLRRRTMYIYNKQYNVYIYIFVYVYIRYYYNIKLYYTI